MRLFRDHARFVRKGFGVYHGAVRDIVIQLHKEVAYLFQERGRVPREPPARIGVGWTVWMKPD
jgi:hypothetical protein